MARYEVVIRRGRRLYRKAPDAKRLLRDLALEGIPRHWIVAVERLPDRRNPNRKGFKITYAD